MQDDSKLPNIVRTAFKGQGMVRSGLETLISDSDELEDEELEKMVKAELVKRLKATQG
jgi:Sec-independent protein translocase protein TatA